MNQLSFTDLSFEEVLALLEERLQCNDIHQAKQCENEILNRFKILKNCRNCKHEHDPPTPTATEHYCYNCCDDNFRWEGK